MDIQPFTQDVVTLAKSGDKKSHSPMGRDVSESAQAKNVEKAADSSPATAKNQLNAAILQSALEVNLTAGNKPLSLIFKTALEGINEALKETFGDNAIQAAYESGLDVSPEATADRIVSLSTAFFGAYQEQHTELDQEQALTAFTEIIRGGIDKGFAEARDILSGLNVLEGKIADDIDSTYALVQDGLKSFVENYKTS